MVKSSSVYGYSYKLLGENKITSKRESSTDVKVLEIRRQLTKLRTKNTIKTINFRPRKREFTCAPERAIRF